MPDDARTRVRYVDISRPRSTDPRIGREGKNHRLVPWEIVEVNGTLYLEPIDSVPTGKERASDKEVTGYSFLTTTHPFTSYNGSGGAAAGPEDAG